MIVAWEAVGLVPKIDKDTELKVRPVMLWSNHDALGRNIVGIISYVNNDDQELLEGIQRRICATVGILDRL